MKDKKIIALLAVILIILTIALLEVLNSTPVSNAKVELDVRDMRARVFMTADHLPEEGFKGCKKIYSDEENDIAIYYNNDYTPVTPVKDTKVIVDDCIEGVIVDVSKTHIIIKVNDSMDIHSGLSGTSIKDDTGNVIAYVIEMVSENELRAVLY